MVINNFFCSPFLQVSVSRRVSTSEPSDRKQSTVDIGQQEKERMEREEIMAAAEASRQNWQQREKVYNVLVAAGTSITTMLAI